MRSTKILIPIDLSELSQKAVTYGVNLSHNIDADITVIHFEEPSNHSSVEISDLRESILHSAEQLGSDGIRFEVQKKKTSISKEITTYAQQHQYDLILMGSGGVSDQDNFLERFKGTNAYQVLHTATCPVLTFTNPPASNQIKNILIPLDLSPGTKQKISIGIKLAKACDAKVHLFSAYPSSMDRNWNFLEDQILAVRRSLDQEGIESHQTILEEEDFPNAILNYSQEISADLIIIMTRPSTQWNEFYITPGAKRIISYAQAPVLGVRPVGKEEIGL